MKTKMVVEKTVWKMWKCDKGNRWISSVRWLDENDGSNCLFSGCKENDHQVRLFGETENPEDAGSWFKNINKAVQS